MSLCVFSMYAYILSEKILSTANNPTFAAFSISCTLKYVPRILYGRLNTFCVFSEYAERMKNFHFQNILGTSKGQHFKKWGVSYL